MSDAAIDMSSIIPAGAFEAMKAGKPQPPKEEAKAAEPKTDEGPKRADPPAPKLPDAKLPEPKKELEKRSGKEESEPAPVPEKKILKLKAAGKELEIDLGDEDGLRRHLSHSIGAQEALKKAAHTEKQAEKFYETIKDPQNAEALRKGPDGAALMAVARAMLLDEMREKSMSPEELAAEKQQREQQRKLADYDSIQEQNAQREANEKRKVWEDHYEKNVMASLDKLSIPKDEHTVNDMIYYLENAVEHGYDITPEEVAQLISTDYDKRDKMRFNGYSGEQLAKALGEDNLKKLRKWDMDQTRDPRSESAQFKPTRKQEPREAGKKENRLQAPDWKEKGIKDFLANY